MLNLENKSKKQIVKVMKEGSEISYSTSVQSFSSVGFTLKLGGINFVIIAGFHCTAVNSLETNRSLSF